MKRTLGLILFLGFSFIAPALIFGPYAQAMQSHWARQTVFWAAALAGLALLPVLHRFAPEWRSNGPARFLAGRNGLPAATSERPADCGDFRADVKAENVGLRPSRPGPAAGNPRARISQEK